MGSGAGIIQLTRYAPEYAGVYEIYYGSSRETVLNPYEAVCRIDLTSAENGLKELNDCYVVPQGAVYILAVRNGIIEAEYELPQEKLLEAEKKYSFGLLSDIHINGDGVDKADSIKDLQKELAYFQADGIDTVVIAGDVTEAGLISDIEAFRAVKKSFLVTTYCCRGNHDTYNDCTIQNWTKLVEPNGMYYEVNIGGDIFLFLGMAMEDISEPFADYALNWLEERLEEYKNQRVFLIQHVFVEPTGNAGGLYQFNEGMINTEGTGARRFRELVKKYRNAVFISGHSHFDFTLERLNPHANIARRTESMCHRIHVPSGSRPRQCDVDTPDTQEYIYSYYPGALGYEVDVYEHFLILRGIDFRTNKLSSVAQYYLDTTPIKFPEEEEGGGEGSYSYAADFTTWEQGSLEASDGSESDSSSSRRCGFVLLNDNPSPSLKCNGRVTYVRVFYYGTDRNYLSKEDFFYDGKYSASDAILALTVAAGAKYIRIKGQLEIDSILFNGVAASEPEETPAKPPLEPLPDGSSFPTVSIAPQPPDIYKKAAWKAVNFIKRQLNTSGFTSAVEFFDITVENELIKPGTNASVTVSAKLTCGRVLSLEAPSVIHNKYLSLDQLYEEEYQGVVSGKWYESLENPQDYRVDVFVITDTRYYVGSCELQPGHTWTTQREAKKGIKHVELVHKQTGLVREYARPVVDNYVVDLYKYTDLEYRCETCRIYLYNGSYYFYGNGEVKEQLLGKVRYLDDTVRGISSAYNNVRYGRLPSSYMIQDNDPNYSRDGVSAAGIHGYMLNSRAFIYDVGLALLVFTMEGEYDLCRELMDRMKYEQKQDGSFNFSLDNYIGQLYEDYIRTGSAGWLVWGMCYFVLKSGETGHREMLKKAGEWLLSRQVTDAEDPRYGLLTGGTGAYEGDYTYVPGEIGWCSTEHNCSALQALKGLHQVLGTNDYAQAAGLVETALMKTLYDANNGRFYQGIGADGVKDEAWALDTLTWAGMSALAAGHPEEASACMDKCLEKFAVSGKTIPVSSASETFNTRYSLPEGEALKGFCPYGEGYVDPPQLVWSEGTLGAVSLLKRLGRTEEAAVYIEEMIKMQNCTGSTGGLVYTSETRASLPYEFHVWESVVGSAWLYLVLQDEDAMFV